MQDIDHRLQEYRFRNVHSKSKTRKEDLTRKVCEETGELILTNHQVRCLAYILGYDDPRTKSHQEGGWYLQNNSGVSDPAFNREIDPLIPEETKVDPKEIGIVPARKVYTTLYRISGVKIAMEELSEGLEIDYDEGRFEIALKAVQ